MVTVAALILQTQCATQSLSGYHLAYGSVAFLAQGERKPEVVFFDDSLGQHQYHRFCDQLSDKMQQNLPVRMLLSSDRKKLIDIN